MTPHFVAREQLPGFFPTNHHTPEFWEWLGRTVATYGFLEEILRKAIFAFTATRRYDESEIEAAFEKWISRLEHVLTATLTDLANSYGKAVRENPAEKSFDIDGLVERLNAAAAVRNVLCHGSWQTPDANGASLPRFVKRKLQVFDTRIDVAYLKQVQAHVVELICDLFDSVTQLGWTFPGRSGPGSPIWK